MMIQQNKSEKGQAIILIVLTIMVVMGLVGLAIDGGQTYSDRRRVQNAADAAALAEALKYRSNVDKKVSPVTKNLISSAQDSAATNGYTDGVNSTITVDPPVPSPAGECPGDAPGRDFTVTIVSTVKTSFAPVVGVSEVQNTVTATARACDFHYQPLFNGNAIVGLSTFNSSSNGDKKNCSIYNWGTSDWVVEGGGVFSNGCARGKGGVTLKTAGTCVNSVGFIDGFSCEEDNQPQFDQEYVDSVTPPEPPCDGTPDGGINVATNPSSFSFSDGVYCVTNFDAFGDKNIYLSNATLYVKDPNGFGPPKMKFTGSGFSGTGRQTGPYAGFFLVIKPGPLGTQEMEWRGNGTGNIYGTIFAPTAVIDLRGNAISTADHSQLIAYQVETLGTANVNVYYEASENRQRSVPPTVTLLR